MDRRSFLVLGAATLTLAACTAPADPGPEQPTPTTPADDDLLRVSVADAEVALIAAYRAALTQVPELAAQLGPFLEHHLAHLERVSPGDERASATPTPSASVAPVEPAVVLAALAAAEEQGRRDRVAACDDAGSGELAHDLALIAASEAQHAVALTALAGQAAR